MITKSRIPFTIVVLLALIGCADSDPLRQLDEVDTSQVTLGEPLDSLLRASHSIELLSLDPDPPQDESPDQFHGWKVLGRASVEPATALTLINDLKAGYATAETELGAPACFNPRHGLRISSADKTLDVVICFECTQIAIYEGNRVVDNLPTSSLPAERFNQVVREYKLPLPRQAEH